VCDNFYFSGKDVGQQLTTEDETGDTSGKSYGFMLQIRVCANILIIDL